MQWRKYEKRSKASARSRDRENDRKDRARDCTDMRFRFIENRRVDYPVRVMCAVLDVSPAGYYASTPTNFGAQQSIAIASSDGERRLHADLFKIPWPA